MQHNVQRATIPRSELGALCITNGPIHALCAQGTRGEYVAGENYCHFVGKNRLTLSQLSLDHLPAYRILLQLQCVVSNIFSMSARSSKVIIGGHKGSGHEAMAQQETTDNTDNTIDDGLDKNALKDGK